MLELMNGAMIESTNLGNLKGKPVHEVKKEDFIKYYDDAQLGEAEGIYFVHEGRGGFRHLIYKGEVVGHVSKGGNVTWFKMAEPWEMLHRPIRSPKETEPEVVMSEVKIPQTYATEGSIADAAYVDTLLERLMAEGDAFRAKLFAEGE